MRRLRVALVHSFYSSEIPSGENRVVESEAAALERAGHDVRVIAARTDDLRHQTLYKVRAAVRTGVGHGRSPLAAVKAFRPDVIHVHNLFPNFGTAWLRSVSDVPVVTTLHNFRLTCANGMLYRDGDVCMRCPSGDRWAGVRHRCYRDSRMATLPVAWAARHGAAKHALLERASRVIVLSARARTIFEAQGVPAEKLLLWSNFLPTELDPGWVSTGSGASRGQPTWLFVGRLSDEKGILHLLKRWPEGHHLTVIGSGPLEEQVGAIADRQPGIHFLGPRSRQEVIARMRESVGLIFPSRWFEVFPLVYLEALAAGLPTLAFEPNVVAEMVGRDGTGMIARWSDDLSALLGAAEERFPTERAHCRSVFDGAYTEGHHVRRVEALYTELTEGVSTEAVLGKQ